MQFLVDASKRITLHDVFRHTWVVGGNVKTEPELELPMAQVVQVRGAVCSLLWAAYEGDDCRLTSSRLRRALIRTSFDTCEPKRQPRRLLTSPTPLTGIVLAVGRTKSASLRSSSQRSTTPRKRSIFCSSIANDDDPPTRTRPRLCCAALRTPPIHRASAPTSLGPRMQSAASPKASRGDIRPTHSKVVV